jgi:hypothetical protein
VWRGTAPAAFLEEVVPGEHATVHTAVHATVADTAVADTAAGHAPHSAVAEWVATSDGGNLLAVPSGLRRYPRVTVERRPWPSEQPGPETVDIEAVRRFTDVVVREVLPTFFRHLFYSPPI